MCSFARSLCHNPVGSEVRSAVSGRAVCTRTASSPMISISCHGIVRLSSLPRRPSILGRPSRIRLSSRAVAGSNTRSSALPRQMPFSSWTISFSHSSRMVKALSPFLHSLCRSQQRYAKGVETGRPVVLYYSCKLLSENRGSIICTKALFLISAA